LTDPNSNPPSAIDLKDADVVKLVEKVGATCRPEAVWSVGFLRSFRRSLG
jgi:hypothetical protein